MKKLFSIGAPLMVLVAGAGVFWLLDWSKPEPDKKEDPVRPLSVFVEPVRESRVGLTIETNGEVRASTSVNLVAQVAGRVVEVSEEFVEGGLVRPGSVLVRIEDTDYQLALRQARAAVADAEVEVQRSLADADVARKQLRNAANPSDLALKKPQVAQARARLQAAEAGLKQAETNLARTQISLPFEGRLMTTSVDVGQYVSPGTPLGSAFATDVVEVRVPLTDAQLASLGLPIGYIAEDEGVPVELSAVVAGQKQVWDGRLVRLDASIEPTTRMIYGIAEVSDPYGSNASQLGMPLAVGLYVNAQISGRDMVDVAVIPREALRAGNQVFVVNEQGRLEVRDVRVAHSDREVAVIANGVLVGEQVVVSSIRNPIAGMALQPLANAEHATADSASVAPSSIQAGS